MTFASRSSSHRVSRWKRRPGFCRRAPNTSPEVVSKDVEATMTAAGMPVSRFRGVRRHPECSYRFRLARSRAGDPVKGPTTTLDAIDVLAVRYAEAWPAWWYRKMAALMRADVHSGLLTQTRFSLFRKGNREAIRQGPRRAATAMCLAGRRAAAPPGLRTGGDRPGTDGCGPDPRNPICGTTATHGSRPPALRAPCCGVAGHRPMTAAPARRGRGPA
jgi:hypothetical protein